METPILYALCSSSLFYLGSRALITSWLWSRYPLRLAVFMDCPACAGTWYGMGCALIGGYVFGLPFLGLPGAHPVTVLVAGLVSMTTTPLAAGLMQRALEAVGHAASMEDHPEGVPDDSGAA
jgi:hypothetical protein